jgi:hypothetical protein
VKKTHNITLTSDPICAEAYNGKGHQSIVEACAATTAALAEMVNLLVPQMKIEFVHGVDEEIPSDENRNKFLLRLTMSKTE